MLPLLLELAILGRKAATVIVLLVKRGDLVWSLK